MFTVCPTGSCPPGDCCYASSPANACVAR
jgi:hypothetical protein